MRKPAVMVARQASVDIIVQSTDSYSDCWNPFFTLFRKYWPTCRHPIILNAETLTYSHPGLDIRCYAQLCPAGPAPATWSESLLSCLSLTQSDVVLLLLDDFFISGPVDDNAVEHYLAVMRRCSYPYITLTDHSRERPAIPTEDPSLLEVSQTARYRLNTSPALWQREALKGYLLPHESGWAFEVFGSRRARHRRDRFFVARSRESSHRPASVIPYFEGPLDTGIVKGRWQRETATFLAREGLSVDYAVRGFYQPKSRFRNRCLLLGRFLKTPSDLFRSLVSK